MSNGPEPEAASVAARVAEALRTQLIAGELRPGEKLSEAALSASLAVSRNTLREVFRLLSKEGLVRHEPHRGVFVASPSHASIIDIYRVRRLVECRAAAAAAPAHPSLGRMREAVGDARAARARGDWRAVGSANMGYHAAIVDLADSDRLNAFYAQIAAELRLAFGLLDDPERLHEPYIEMNAAILDHLLEGRAAEAAEALERYLLQSERTILAAFSRLPAPREQGRRGRASNVLR